MADDNNSKFDLSRIKTINLKNRYEVNNILFPSTNTTRFMNISTFEGYTRQFSNDSLQTILNSPGTTSDEIYKQNPGVNSAKKNSPNESPFTIPIEILRNINNYRFVYTTPILATYTQDKVYKEKNGKTADEVRDYASYGHYGSKQVAQQTDPNNFGTGEVPSDVIEYYMPQYVVSSIFNPLFNVQITGGTNNTPLLYDANAQNEEYVKLDVHNCTIKELVRLSNAYKSPLGNARYRFTDFMYCKDLGKMPNNHLITLRKFPYPVPDNIFELTTSGYAQQSSLGDLEITGDVGRLVTWFGTEDNKLEDILKYNYKASWKKLESKIQEKDSQENSENRGALGPFINSFSANYLKEGGMAGTNNIWSKMLGSITGIPESKLEASSEERKRYSTYDNNKVYTPLNTIQETHIYEGKLEFSQDISLKFCYKMRGYENINGKSAMLDLLGNILEVTYRRGKFWGGENRIIGPPPNPQGWKKANAFIDKAFDTLGNIFSGLADGTLDVGALLANICNAASDVVNKAADKAKEMVANPKEAIASGIKKMGQLGIGTMLRGQLKNAIGRPSFYAFDSLLPDGLSGLWHLTIGNPKNPIMSIGNLILDSADVQHSGPLGIDDFPTEITVTVKLKHAKPRDITNIGKMYTRGVKSIYTPSGPAYLHQLYGKKASINADITNAQAQYDYYYQQDMKAYAEYEQKQADALKFIEIDENSNEQTIGKDAKKEIQPYKTSNTKSSGALAYNLFVSQQAIVDARYKETEAARNANAESIDRHNYLINKENYAIAFTNQERATAIRAVIDEIA